jgi:diguanylate cyclase (GGDEF)-like protein/PAS domain S-box-containing protein
MRKANLARMKHTIMQPHSSLLTEIGLDDAEIKRRQAFLAFDDRDIDLLKSLHDMLANRRDTLIEAFYDHLLRFPEMRPLLGDETKQARLKQAQSAYFSQLTEGCYDPAYVENRLHVGVVHQRIGLTPKWYMSAYCKYLSEVIPLVLDRYHDEPEHRLDACRALFKVVFFDMGLALDTYFHAEHKSLMLARSYTEQIVSNMPIGFIVLDEGGKIALVNNAVLRMFKLDRAVTWQGRTIGQYLDLAILEEKIVRVLESEKSCKEFEFDRIVDNIDRSYLANISLAQMGEETVALFMVQDITSRKQSEEEIHRLAFYDPLTHLPNRRLLHERLLQSMSFSARSGKFGALMFLDMDNFKTINDAQGHDIGDRLLKEVARRLIHTVREGDTVARLGGDEFVVVLDSLSNNPHEAVVQSEMVAEKIRTVLDQPYPFDSIEHHSSPSIGVTVFRGHQNSLEEMLKQADLAMYQAKAGGRNRICFFDPATQEEMDNRARLETDLRASIRFDQMQLYYQMQVDDSGRIIGAEALIRWLHPERGMVSPAQFIPLAEEIGMIVPIGMWVIEQACIQLKTWETDPVMDKIQVSVNVSPAQLNQPDFVDQIKRVVEKTGVCAFRLKLELTESLVLNDVEEVIEKMQKLNRIGINFAMDDFGTGYSSLSYLKRLPLEQLKIDQSFLQDITQDKNSGIMVRTIISIASNFGLKVVAEGVETDGQLAFLCQYGCNLFQGYLFGKPVPVTEFEEACHASVTAPVAE